MYSRRPVLRPSYGRSARIYIAYRHADRREDKSIWAIDRRKFRAPLVRKRVVCERVTAIKIRPESHLQRRALSSTSRNNLRLGKKKRRNDSEKIERDRGGKSRRKKQNPNLKEKFGSLKLVTLGNAFTKMSARNVRTNNNGPGQKLSAA